MIQKGKWGYLEEYKKKQMGKIFLSFGVIIAIVVTALLTAHTTKTVVIVAAILGALPAAKILVGYLIVMPYRSYKGERLPEKVTRKGRELFDLAISSEERITYVPYLYMNAKCMYMFVSPGRKPIDKKGFRRYIQNWMKGESLYFTVKVFEEEKEFFHAVKMDEERQEESKTENDLDKAVERLFILVI